jgi:hypothetical protein
MTSVWQTLQDNTIEELVARGLSAPGDESPDDSPDFPKD